jgi:hypothetical protein
MFTTLLQVLFAGIAVAILTAIAVSIKAAPARIPVRIRENEHPVSVRKNR